MNRHTIMAAGCAIVAALAVCARAADVDVGKAAMDPSQISEMLAGVEDGEKATFLKQVVEAATKMPIDPEKRPGQIAEVISAAIDAMPADQMPELLSALVCKVPFSLLPATIDALIPGMRTRTEAMSEDKFNDSLARAVKAVRDQGLEDDDADIYAAFVIALFAKIPAVEDNTPVIEQGLSAVPEEKHDSIASMVNAILAGDYAQIFGPEGAGELIPVTAFGQSETVFVDVELERPAIIEGDGEGGGKPGGHKKPPVPTDYKGQGALKK